MNRQDFGFWGIELDADAFARALAAYGVLLAAERLEPVSPSDPGLDAVTTEYATRLQNLFQAERPPSRLPLRWNMSAGEPTAVPRNHVAALALAWDQAVQATWHLLRVEVDASWRQGNASPTWIVEELSRQAVGLASVYVDASLPPEQAARTAWTWPLDVGLLSDDASRRLRTTLAADHWAGHLFDLAEIGADHETCNVLLLPFGLRESVTRVLQTPVRASCVLLLGELGEPWERARPMLQTIEAHARAGAIGIVRVPETRRDLWFHELVRELSHNNVGLDVALYLAFRHAALFAAPLLFATGRLLDRTLMTEVAASLGRRIERADMADRGVDWIHVISDSAMANGLAPPSAGASPGEALSTFSFNLESEGASVVADVGRVVRAQPPAPVPRFLQARVMEVRDATAPEHLTTAFRAQAPHHIIVRIGPEDETWIAATDPFPVEELPESDQPHRLRVVFTDLRLEREPQVGEMLLPKQGASSEVRFALQTGTAGEQIEVRIIVLHRNRVLQTVLLRGPVAADPDAPNDDRSIQITTEVIARARLDDLTGRSRFDAAIVLNHTDKGLSRLTRIAGERVDISEPVDIELAVSVMQAALETFIDEPAERVSLESKQMLALFISLARQGRTFYDAIVLDQVGEEFASADRIQIVSASPEAYLPIEFVYDRTAPRPNAMLCPQARSALAKKRCPESCGTIADQASVVCPLGFWGLTKVIERHVHTPERANEVRRDFGLLREPVAGRAKLNPVGNVTFAASAKVDDFRAGMSAEVLRSLRRTTSAEVSQARTWTKWVADITKLTPSLLVILPHTLSADGIPTMEVGKRAHLGAVDIADAHVSASPDTLPIVLLLGCETGDPTLAFQQFPAAFRRKGAAIVLATLTKVLGRHAAPVATRLVAALVEQSRQEHVTFGDVMLDMRRELLLDGYPMVLALTAYGDADWRFGALDA
ncbi:MAG TPA: hypothetical protein VHG52_13210 [Thermomicrobiales bacterium]|nr:hypothetical protein [Thermomicrobiales bacterium]